MLTRIATLTAALALALPGPAMAQNLVGHGTFDGNSNDSSGRNNHATRTGRTVTIPNSPSLQTNQFTVAYWVYVSASKGDMAVATKGTAAGLSVWETNIVPGLDSNGMWGQSVQLCLGSGQHFSTVCKTSPALSPSPAGRWMHVAFTYDGNTAIGYADGIPMLTFAGTFFPGNSKGDIHLGLGDFLVRDLHIYDAALAPAAVSQLGGAAALGTNSILLGSAATSSSVVLSTTASWTATANDSFLHITAGSASGTGSALVLFSIDALNSTGSRTGTITIAGLTLTITQAGTNYTASTTAVEVSSINVRGLTLALDAAGNMYVVGDVTETSCDYNGLNCIRTVTDGLLQKVNATTKAVTTLASGLKGPGAVAVDGSGNVYIADAGNNAIRKWTAATQQLSTLISGLSNPRGVAVDSAGNLYIANTGDHEITKWTAATQQLTTLIAGLNFVPGVAVDIAGNVYFTESDAEGSNTTAVGSYDPAGRYVVAYYAAHTDHGTIKKWTASTQQVTTLVSLNHPWELVVDGSGNLYVMDANYNVGLVNPNLQFPRVPRSWNAATGQLTSLAAYYLGGFPLSRGVAVDGLGNVYLTSYEYFEIYKIPYAQVPSDTVHKLMGSGSDVLPPVLPVTTDLSGNNAPQSDQGWLTLGAVPGGVVPFSYTANATGSARTAHISILGVQTAIAQDRTTVPNLLGQTQAAATTAITGAALTVGNVSTALSGTLPAGSVISVFPVTGTQVVVGSAVNLVISAGKSALGANAIQVDSAAASYSVVLSSAVAWHATANSSFLHLAAGGSSGTGSSLFVFTIDAFGGTGSRTGTLTIAEMTFTVTQWGTNFLRVTQPTTLVTAPPKISGGVALDSAGNVLVIDTTNNTIDQWTSATQQLTTLVSGIAPHGLARDGIGNLYIADTGNNAIIVLSAATGAVTAIFSGLNSPSGVAVDSAGDLYVTDTGSNAVKKLSVTTGAVTTLASGLNQPSGTAVDRAGNVYIADTGNHVIKVWSVATGAVTTLVSGLSSPNGVAVDGFGNLYITDGGGLRKWNVTTGQVETLDPGFLYVFDFNQGSYVSAATAVAADATGNVYAEFNFNFNANYPALVKYSFAFVPAVAVPNVVSQTQATATAAITGAGLVAGTVTNVISATVPVGSVVSTSPAAGTTVVLGSAVNLVISVQPEQVPNVAGQTQAAATTAITNASLVVGAVTTTYSNTVASGIVISQNPAGGTTVLINSAVNLVVSIGPFPVAVPDVIAQTQAAASTAITGASLVVGTVTTAVSPTGLSNPRGVIPDLVGNVYIADTGNNAIKKWNAATGQLTTLVSSGLNQPGGVGIDKSGNVYIADTGNDAIKKWDAVTNQVTTLVSTGLNRPQSVVVERHFAGPYNILGNQQVQSNGDVYIADTGNNAIKIWSAATQQVTTLVSSGLNQPAGVGFCIGGGVYIADTGNNAIKVVSGGQATSVISIGLNRPTAVVCTAYTDNATAFFNDPNTAVLDFIPYNDLYIADSGNNAIKFWFAANPNTLYTVASGLNQPWGVASDGKDTVWVADTGNNRLQKITSQCGAIRGQNCGVGSIRTPSNLFRTVPAGTVLSSSPAAGAIIALGSAVNLTIEAGPVGLATSSILAGSAAVSSSVFLAFREGWLPGTWNATANDSFLHVSPGSASGTASAWVAFTIDAFAGTGTRTGTLTIAGLTLTVIQVGSDYVATGQLNAPISGAFSSPNRVAVDGSGNVYVADSSHSAIKKWSPTTQQVTTLISTGITFPQAVAVDGFGNLYIGDNGSLCKWTAATQQLSTLLSGLTQVSGVALDSSGNVYFSNGTTKISKWTAATQVKTDLVSTGLLTARGVALDNSGNVYFADAIGNTIKMWSVATQQVTTLVSTGLDGPWGVAVDRSGDVYFADARHSAIKKWSATTLQVTTLVTGSPVSATNRYRGLAMDESGNLYFVQTDGNVIGQLSKAYVSAGSLSEPNTAGTGALPPVIPIATNLTGTFAPTSDQPWLTIGTVANGIVNFSFAANATGSPRTAHITVLGIQFTVNQGLLVAVPNVVSQAQAAAASAITGAGLVVGTVTTASSSTVGAGSVIGTSPAAGTQVNPGSAVNLVVSTGPAQPAAAVDVTGQLTVTRGVLVFNRTTNRYTQSVTASNAGAAISSAAFVLDNLAAGYALYQSSGLTVATTPVGSSYKEIGPINAGATVTFTIELTRTGTPALTYTPRILGAGAR